MFILDVHQIRLNASMSYQKRIPPKLEERLQNSQAVFEGQWNIQGCVELSGALSEHTSVGTLLQVEE